MFCNEIIFEEESQVYREEGLNLSPESIKFKDNSPCVNLLEGRPYGLFTILHEETLSWTTSFQKASDASCIDKFEMNFGIGKKFVNKNFLKHK